VRTDKSQTPPSGPPFFFPPRSSRQPPGPRPHQAGRRGCSPGGSAPAQSRPPKGASRGKSHYSRASAKLQSHPGLPKVVQGTGRGTQSLNSVIDHQSMENTVVRLNIIQQLRGGKLRSYFWKTRVESSPHTPAAKSWQHRRASTKPLARPGWLAGG